MRRLKQSLQRKPCLALSHCIWRYLLGKRRSPRIDLNGPFWAFQQTAASVALSAKQSLVLGPKMSATTVVDAKQNPLQMSPPTQL